MIKHIYQDHLGGGFYVLDEEQSYDDLYCETCGDADMSVYDGDINHALPAIIEFSILDYDDIYVDENNELNTYNDDSIERIIQNVKNELPSELSHIDKNEIRETLKQMILNTNDED